MKLILVKGLLWARLGAISHLTKQSVTDLQKLLPAYMYILYQYGPMTEGGLGWV